jgi:hypothetical protein
MKKDKKNSFHTPEGYFESFNDRLMDRIHDEEAKEVESRIPKTDGFVVPDGYLDGLTPAILSKSVEKEAKVISFKPNRNFYYGAAAVAALLVLFFGINWNPNTEPISFDDLANAEIEAYFEQTDLDMSSYEIAEVVSVTDIQLNDVLTDDLEDDILMDYLDENVDDIEELNLEATP